MICLCRCWVSCAAASKTVGEIAGNLRRSRLAISEHLRLLRSAGVVVSQQHGTAHICRLNAKPLRAIDDGLRYYQVFWSDTTQRRKTYVEPNP